MPVGEILTSDLHQCLFKFWKSNKCYGLASWHAKAWRVGGITFLPYTGNPVCLSLLDISNWEYFYNKQLCKSACLNTYMKFSANGSPRGRRSTPNPHTLAWEILIYYLECLGTLVTTTHPQICNWDLSMSFVLYLRFIHKEQLVGKRSTIFLTKYEFNICSFIRFYQFSFCLHLSKF